MLNRTADNPILQAYRGHRDHDAEFGPEEEMELHPLQQWDHWLHWGDQEVSLDPEHIADANLIIHRLHGLAFPEFL